MEKMDLTTEEIAYNFVEIARIFSAGEQLQDCGFQTTPPFESDDETLKGFFEFYLTDENPESLRALLCFLDCILKSLHEKISLCESDISAIRKDREITMLKKDIYDVSEFRKFISEFIHHEA